MHARIEPLLAALSAEIAGTRTELTMARERLAERETTLEEYRLRMLIAETPLADRDLHSAALIRDRARAEVDRLEAALATLRDEERRLAENPA